MFGRTADHASVNNIEGSGCHGENGQQIVGKLSVDGWGFPIGDGNGHA